MGMREDPALQERLEEEAKAICMSMISAGAFRDLRRNDEILTASVIVMSLAIDRLTKDCRRRGSIKEDEYVPYPIGTYIVKMKIMEMIEDSIKR